VALELDEFLHEGEVARVRLDQQGQKKTQSRHVRALRQRIEIDRRLKRGVPPIVF
jgi:hypothetical protein